MTSEGTLDGRYLEWLYQYVGPARNRNPARSHWLLAEQLFRTPFSWSVPNDDNRIEDARDLRYVFLEEDGAEPDEDWIAMECSMLEVFIGLSTRAAFETSQDQHTWFWKILENVNLRIYTDENYDEDAVEVVSQTIATVIDRTYKRDGSGGLFPLKRPGSEDQREVELWYQMSSYLLEHGFG